MKRNNSLTEIISLTSITIIIGTISGLLTVIYREFITLISHLFAQFNLSIFAPAIGGLIGGVLIYHLAPQLQNFGAPKLIEDLTNDQQTDQTENTFIKALSTAISIASGNSVGATGPIIALGANTGTLISSLNSLPQSIHRLLATCGISAGIAALFNAPLAGIFFALEVVLKEFDLNTLTLIIISTICGTTIGELLKGSDPFFLVTNYNIINNHEYFFYIILGIMSALISRLFIIALSKLGAIFYHWQLPAYVKPMLSGAIVGLISLITPLIKGLGTTEIEQILHNRLLLSTVAGLIILKLLATAVTLGSGQIGGIFTPTLFIGAALGSSLGIILNQFYPALTSTPGTYALVGMAALLASTMQAPLTAIFLLFELTRDYQIILPLLITCILSTVISQSISSETIYSYRLFTAEFYPDSPLTTNKQEPVAEELMTTKEELQLAYEDDNLKQINNLLKQSQQAKLPVINRSQELVGLIKID
ncbi:MAG: chloride channel protein [Bacillota bacterium]